MPHLAGHDVPREGGFVPSQNPNPGHPLGLELEERLVGGEADVIAPLRASAAQSSALTPREEEDRDLACKRIVSGSGSGWILSAHVMSQ